MHPHIRRRSRALASATVLALLAVPSPAVAAPDPGDPADGRSSGPAAQARPGTVDPADKITPAATKAFRARGATDFWLRFADKPDLTATEAITSWEERGEYVYDTLVATADAAQERAIAELEESGAEYTSYWASNAILVEDGSLDQAVELAANAEVLEVRPTTRHALPEPETKEAPAPTAAAKSTYGIRAINADDMWNRGFTGDGVVVAGLDTGVGRNHPALAKQYRGATSGSDYNWFDAAKVGAGVPRDGDGHGTHTMGTMVGTDDGAMNIGVAPGAQWVATNGCADDCSDAALIASGQWFLAPTRTDGTAPDPARRPHVVNNSWGLSFSTDPFMEDVISAWEAAGIFSAWANGNEGEFGCESSGSPGARQISYSVGAFTPSGAIASFSSRGPGQSGTVKPDIAAPGETVRSAVPGGRYEQWSGTSMAAPHVAGAVALLWDAVPELVGDVTRTRAILDGSAADVRDTSCGGTTDDNNVWGEGKLDVLAAYELAQAQAFAASPEPVVSGAQSKVGVQLTATVPAWSPAATFTYQWRRSPSKDEVGAMIPGATKATYTPKGEDAGAYLSVTVLGSADGRTPTARTSAETDVVAVGVMTAAKPTISPTARVGTTLYAKSGTWTSGTRFTYQWLANGTPIPGAKAFTFVPTSTHRGKQLTVTITGKRTGYAPETRTSSAVTVGYGTFSTRYPRIMGSPAPGQTVKASTPQWVPARSTTSYTWKIDGRVIRGANSSSFRVPSNYAAGRVLTVTVKGQRAGFTTKALQSMGYKVGKPFVKKPFPKLSGSVRVGSRLTVSPGTWSPSASLSYRWYASGKPIAGATGKAYRLKGSDHGKKIVATVTARKPGYATTSRTSTPTVAVAKPVTTMVDLELYDVGRGGIAPGTYVVSAGSRECSWERGSGWDALGSGIGSGPRITTLQSTDDYFFSLECGRWSKYYSGMAEPKTRTFNNGVYVLGDQLQRGTYVTSGPAVATAGSCRYAFLAAFTGNLNGSNVVASGSTDASRTITVPAAAKGFETSNCSWQRVG
ncbi:S8 family serine peptidase [Promicromonospora iranensis]|uniref:Subtilisin family serine protease n=1 Tax=Promicromonospora iranensis TaxID=1105144 RepID=A0ABU2CLY2_9MICO|nr:S8 family serine peptidase [Promicromonospora iranensis]MDR7382349.1 subtilisin family serine protease [Promicromonospora iranensis]